MLKKFLIILSVMIFCSTSALCEVSKADLVRSGVAQYKAQNYSGCICTMKDVIKRDPSNVMAQYYTAISYARLGDREQALNYYNKVVSLNSNSTLTSYSKNGIEAINKAFKYNAENTQADRFVQAGYKNGVHPDIRKQLKLIELEKTKNEINKNLNAPAIAKPAPSAPATTTPEQQVPPADATQMPNATSYNNQPTDAEIANAVKTLAAAGINPLQLGMNSMPNQQTMQQYSQSASELAQLQMMLGTQNNNSYYNNNNMMNMLPYMMQNGQNNPAMSKEYLQTLMMSQMMPNFSFDTSTKN